MSHRAIDLGQFIGDLLETSYFEPSIAPSVIILINNFTAGYSSVEEDMSFRIALHAGVHMINWWSRGPKKDSKEGRQLLDKALEIVARAWERDKAWFHKHEVFCGLFEE